MAVNNIFGASSIDDLADNVLSGVDDFMLTVEKMQKRKVASNVQLVVQALKKIESDLQDKYDGVTTVIEKRVSTIKDGRDGINGRDGRDGKDGRPGKDGMPGARGKDGAPGQDGADGMDGVSVTDARIDFDGSLIIVLSSGREINVGEVVTPDLAERIKVITNGGGTSQGVLDTLASLQAQINLLSSALVYAGTWNASTNTPTLASGVGTANTFYIVSVAGTTTLNGISNWGVGDWAIFNGTVWQRVEGGAEGNFTNLSVSGNATLGDAVGDSVTVNATATFNNADVTIHGVRVGRGAGAVATNTAVGSGALASNTSGVGQTAVGFSALGQSTGSRNVAFGGGDAATYNAALASNTSGTDNAAFGIGALSANLTGVGNTSLGVGSLYFSTASNNTAVGFQAGAANQTGTNLVLVGRAAGFSNKASNNTFVGDSAGYSNDTGTYNTFVGVNAGLSINTGAKNTIIGSYSGNQGGLDIRTASNYIVLSDGDGNPRAYWNGANPTFPGNATFSAGTANGVAYLNGSKVLTTGSALTFDGNTLTVGAGAQTGYRLQSYVSSGNDGISILNGANGAGDFAALSFVHAGNQKAVMYTNSDNLTINASAGAAIFQISTTEAMRLTSSGLEVKQSQLIGYSSYAGIGTNGLAVAGNVGIGTSSPAAKLDVFADANAANTILLRNANTSTANYGTQAYYRLDIAGSSIGGLKTTAKPLGGLSTPALYLTTAGAYPIAFGLNDSATPAMVLDTSGNLGIGTSSPSLKLDVNGSAKFAGSYVSFNDNGYIRTDAANILRFQPGSGGYQFRNQGNSDNLAVLDSSGNLGLGVTPSAWSQGRAIEMLNPGHGLWNGSGSPASTYVLANAYFNSGFKYGGTGQASHYYQYLGQHIWSTAASGTAGNAITFTQALTLDSNRNLLLNGTAAPASGVGTFAIFNGTAPTGSVTDGIVLYAEDVSSSSELKVRDEAGNVTTLSPHNFDLIPEGPSEDMAWSYYSERDGKRINVDMLKAIRLLEKLSGEKLVHFA